MTRIYYISHPDVLIEPKVPIPDWDLSEQGHQRLENMLSRPWVSTLQAVFCSNEQKAKTAARRIAEHLRLQARILPDLGEFDRSATGYLPPPELDTVVEAVYVFFDQSIRGWEKVVDV